MITNRTARRWARNKGEVPALTADIEGPMKTSLKSYAGPLATLRGSFRKTRPVWEMGLGALLALLLSFAALHLAWIATNVSRDGLVISILALCYGFYLIRHFFRLAYGTVEIVIGFFAIFGAMDRAPQVVDDPATATLLLVQLAAGMYIIIRGFDNFAQSEPFAGGGSKFMALWELVGGRWGQKRKKGKE